MAAVYKVSTSSKFRESGLKFSINFSQKAQIEQFSIPPLSFKIKSITLQLTISTYFSKINRNLVKNTENVNETTEYRLLFTSITPYKNRKSKNLFTSIFYAGRAF